MMMKADLEIPYYSDGPLSDKSTWAAFPVEFVVRNKNYAAGLTVGRKLVCELEAAISDLANGECEMEKPPLADKQDEFRTIVQFRKLNNEMATHIYRSVHIQFMDQTEFWKKMEIVSLMLDTIGAFSEKFSKDKTISINLGVKFVGMK